MRALAVFEKRLAVGHLPGTYVIEVDFQSLDPSRAAQIANAVINAFIEDQVEAKYQTIGTATAWLQERLNELRAQASAAERAVVEYKTKNNIVDSGGGHLMNEQQLVELNTALGKAHADAAEAKARFDRVSQVLSAGDVDPSTTEVATVADALHSEVISKFRVQYLELQQREVLLSARVGHDHLAMVNLRNQMREMRRSIFQELQRIGAAYKSDYDIAKARESSLEKSLASTVSGLKRRTKRRSNCVNLKVQRKATVRSMTTSNNAIRILCNNNHFPYLRRAPIAPALAPSAPSSPKSLRILAIAALGGLGLGVGFAILRELLDRVFRTSRQVESRLRTESVFMLPILKPSDQAAELLKASPSPAGE